MLKLLVTLGVCTVSYSSDNFHAVTLQQNVDILKPGAVSPLAIYGNDTVLETNIL